MSIRDVVPYSEAMRIEKLSHLAGVWVRGIMPPVSVPITQEPPQA